MEVFGHQVPLTRSTRNSDRTESWHTT